MKKSVRMKKGSLGYFDESDCGERFVCYGVCGDL